MAASNSNWSYVEPLLRFAQSYMGNASGAPGDTNTGSKYAKSYGPFKPTFVPTFRTPRSDEEAQKMYNHVRTVAWYMDALPFLSNAGLPFRVGVDDIISLIPLYGDFVGLVLSLYQIVLSWIFGVPLYLLGWMVVNVVADFAVGIIPIIGDILDCWFKANLRNLDILEDWLLKDATNYHISLMPKNEFLPKARQRSRWSSSRAQQQPNGRDKYRNPSKTERMKKGMYTPEDLD